MPEKHSGSSLPEKKGLSVKIHKRIYIPQSTANPPMPDVKPLKIMKNNERLKGGEK